MTQLALDATVTFPWGAARYVGRGLHSVTITQPTSSYPPTPILAKIGDMGFAAVVALPVVFVAGLAVDLSSVASIVVTAVVASAGLTAGIWYALRGARGKGLLGRTAHIPSIIRVTAEDSAEVLADTLALYHDLDLIARHTDRGIIDAHAIAWDAFGDGEAIASERGRLSGLVADCQRVEDTLDAARREALRLVGETRPREHE